MNIYPQCCWSAVLSLLIILPTQASQTLTHLPAAQPPGSVQIQQFCNRYRQAKKSYQQQYLKQYRQYCGKRQSVAVPTNQTQKPVAFTPTVPTVAGPRVKQLSLPACLQQGSILRVSGEHFRPGKVACSIRPALGLALSSQSANTLQYRVTGTPLPHGAYRLSCSAGNQNLSSRRVNTCISHTANTQVTVPAAANTRLAAAVDLTGTLALIPPVRSGKGEQQSFKVEYQNLGQNRGQGRTTATFAMEIFLVSKKATGNLQSAATVSNPRKLVLRRIPGNTILANGIKQSRFVSIRLPANLTIGTYHWCVRLDSGNQIAESNEHNNTHCITQTISSVAGPLPARQLPGLFGAKLRGKPVTTRDGKSLLGPQVDLSQVHTLDDGPPAGPLGTPIREETAASQVSVPLNSSLGPDLMVRNIVMNSDRTGIFVDWVSWHDRPLPAGQFTWSVYSSEARSGNALVPQGRDAAPGTIVPHPLLPGSIVRGVVRVAESATAGRIAVDLPATLRGNIIKVHATINTGDGGIVYPESPTRDNSLTKHLYTTRSLPAHRPSEILGFSHYPAHGAEHILVRYSLDGALPGRLGISAADVVAPDPLHTTRRVLLECRPDAGDGYTLARPGWNQTLHYVCPLSIQEARNRDRWGTVNLVLLDAAGSVADRFSQSFTFHHPIAQEGIDDQRKPDLTVRIVGVARNNGRAPSLVVDVANEGGLVAASSELDVRVSQIRNRICNWTPRQHRQIRALAAGQHRRILFVGGSCRSWTPGTLRYDREEDTRRISVVIDGNNRITELNETNNTASRSIGDSLVTVASDPTIRIERLSIHSTAMDVDCTELGSIDIYGGPFPTTGIQLQLDAGSDRSNRWYQNTMFATSYLRPRIEYLSSNQLRIRITKCLLNNEQTMKLRLQYPHGGHSRWLVINNRP